MMISTPRQDPRKRAFWCGPAAISAVTGQTVEQLGLGDTRTMSWLEIKSHFRVAGFTLAGVPVAKNSFVRVRRCPYSGRRVEESVLNSSTIAKVLDSRTPEQRRSVMLIVASNHISVVHLDWLIDNVFPNGIAVQDYPFRRRRVVRAVVVKKEEQ